MSDVTHDEVLEAQNPPDDALTETFEVHVWFNPAEFALRGAPSEVVNSATYDDAISLGTGALKRLAERGSTRALFKIEKAYRIGPS